MYKNIIMTDVVVLIMDIELPGFRHLYDFYYEMLPVL